MHVVEGGRHPAVVEPPQGELRIGALPPARLKLSLVIPTYNESRNLAELLARLTSILDARLPGSYELIVVDDDSPDQTWALALRLAEKHPAVRVMRRRGEKGLSTAVVRGWQVARGEVLAVIDADLQHPPEIVQQLWDRMAAGADLAVASRHTGGGGVSDWSAARRALSRGAQLLGLCVLPSVMGRVSDPMSGYFMVRRSAIEGTTLSPLGYKILVEVLGRGRVARIAEVGYVFRERSAGESKVTGKLYFEYLRHLFRLRLALLPARFPKFAAVGLSGVLVDMLCLWLLKDRLGWALTPAKLLAAELAIVNNFLWNDVWTFGDLAEQQGYGVARLRRLARFNLICLAGLALSVGLLTMQVTLFTLNPYLANAIAIAATTGWNFWMNKIFSWASPERLAVPAVQRRAVGA
ncbi:MAG TPA: glycosyltransferase family 2 protein [Myxococcales bacterium]|nr:glycosyltransferase family 2 protein [Myxococcales bacterium]